MKEPRLIAAISLSRLSGAVGHRCTVGLFYFARWPSDSAGDARAHQASHCSTPSTAPAHWSSAAAMSCCRCCAKPSSQPSWVSDEHFWRVMAPPRRFRSAFHFSAYLGAVVNASTHGIAGAVLGPDREYFCPACSILLGTLPFWDGFGNARARKRPSRRQCRGCRATGRGTLQPVWLTSVKMPATLVSRCRICPSDICRAPPLLAVVTWSHWWRGIGIFFIGCVT